MRRPVAYGLVASSFVLVTIAVIIAPRQPSVARTSTVTIAAAGDICGQDRPLSCKGTADLVRSLDPTVALALGDNQYQSGTLQQYLDSYDLQWGTFKAGTRPAPGNHEWGGSLIGYTAYFGSRVLTSGRPWYSFDLGGWHLVSLDGTCSRTGGCGPGSAQYAFLKADLSDDDHPCTLAYWHQPLFSSGSTHGGSASVRPLWSLLYAEGAEIVLNGHEHNYERFRPQTPWGQAAAGGIVQFVVGTGGVGTYPFGPAEPNSAVRITNTKGVTELALSPNGWASSFVAVGGTVKDRTSGTCH